MRSVKCQAARAGPKEEEVDPEKVFAHNIFGFLSVEVRDNIGGNNSFGGGQRSYHHGSNNTDHSIPDQDTANFGKAERVGL